ncbi:hypothetical protein ACHAW5_003777 [Stephanodiscus triporus]|uniref:Uncharacterized protein n=1 Tax=Stephanodiscus triporus TaxID=2934178 RepID=A0ABD3NM58_9STRA
MAPPTKQAWRAEERTAAADRPPTKNSRGSGGGGIRPSPQRGAVALPASARVDGGGDDDDDDDGAMAARDGDAARRREDDDAQAADDDASVEMRMTKE